MQDSRRSERGRERSEMNAKDDGLRTGGQTKRGASLHLIPVERERQREVGQGSKEGELDAMREEEVEVCACVCLLACLLAGVACVCACAHTCEPATTTPVQRRCPAARYGRWLWDDHWGFGDRRRSMQVQCIAAQRERKKRGSKMVEEAFDVGPWLHYRAGGETRKGKLGSWRTARAPLVVHDELKTRSM